MSTLKVANISDGVNTASMTDAVRGSARAWVVFDGTGTIKNSYNVNSVTDNYTGDYTINFDSAMIDAEYSIAGMAKRANTNNHCVVTIKYTTTPTASAVTVVTVNDVVAAIDPSRASVVVFR